MIKTDDFAAIPQHRVCLVYDEKMTLHAYVPEPGKEEPRASARILEHPDRITSIYKQLIEDQLVDRCLQLESRYATKKELLWQHDPDYLETMEATEEMNQSELALLEEQFATNLITPINVFLCPDSQQAALLSAGSALQVVESILSGQSRSGVAIIRPPGHHAEGDKAYGFCIYNNTAMAAKYALQVHGLKRVLIVDWDVHHGNGIQKMFLDEPRVLYISMHCLEKFPFDFENADSKVIGTGPGKGFNVNISWPTTGMGDSDYLAAFHRTIMPIALQFDPQLVLVAAGFDSARGDPVGKCDVTPEGYAQMTHLLTSLASGRVALLLEGGYNLESISKSMSKCVQALLGDPIPSAKVGPVNSGAASAIVRANKYLRPYWTALKFHSQEDEFDAADELFASVVPTSYVTRPLTNVA